jgi:hypothetical protein
VKRLALLLPALAASLSACVVVPATVTRYDPECRIIARHMTLHPVQLASIGGCVDHGCVTLVAVAAATAAASTVISGSIAIVGNVVYWLEERGQCAHPGARVPPPMPMPMPMPPAVFAHPLPPR